MISEAVLRLVLRLNAWRIRSPRCLLDFSFNRILITVSDDHFTEQSRDEDKVTVMVNVATISRMFAPYVLITSQTHIMQANNARNFLSDDPN